MEILVGRWDCAACGQVGIQGPLTRCPSCGSARPENVEFYLPESAEALTDAEEIRKAKSGADWVCTHCSTHNKAWLFQCEGCGSPRDEAGEGDAQLQQRDILYDQPPKDAPAPKAAPRPQSKRNVYVVLGLVLTIIALFFVFKSESTYEVVVEGHAWERSVALENYREVEEEDWQLPQQAKLINSFQAVHHTEQKLKGYQTKTRSVRVQVGEERYEAGVRDLGNGTFEKIYKTRPVYENREETYQDPIYEDVPIYRTKYRYRIFRWKKLDPLQAQGKDTKPIWPKLPPKPDPENWRTGKQKATYTLYVKDPKGKTHSTELPLEQWQTLQKGQQVPARKGSVAGDFRGLALDKK
ncbi:MAG: zinc finger Ran-binding domain-containing protein [Bernardetiaceae bacterium]